MNALPLFSTILKRTLIVLVGLAGACGMSGAQRPVTGAWISETNGGSVLRCFYDEDHFYTEIVKPDGVRVFSGYGTYALKDDVIEYAYTTSDNLAIKRGARDREQISKWEIGGFEVATPKGRISYREISQGPVSPPPQKISDIRVYDPGELTEPPLFTKKVPPEYPFDQRSGGVQGEVVLECILNAAGKVVNVRSIAASHPSFARSAEKAVREWRAKPGRIGKEAVASRLIQKIAFHLE